MRDYDKVLKIGRNADGGGLPSFHGGGVRVLRKKMKGDGGGIGFGNGSVFFYCVS